MKSNAELIELKDVNTNLVNLFLEPYKDDCKYLQKAYFSNSQAQKNHENQSLWVIKGDFAIPESCYISATGHFNSVEFNICYNQLFYIMIAYLLDNHLLAVMQDWDLETYKRRQLSNFLIVKFSSIFRRPINPSKFQGTLSINKSSVRGNLIILKTTCNFSDNQDGWSEGDITIAVLNSEPELNLDNSPESVSV